MKYLKNFLKESIHDDSDMLYIQLSRKEYELLESILESAIDNNIYGGEEKSIFTEEEKLEISEYLEKDEAHGADVYLHNYDYLDYIYARLKDEFKNNNVG